MRNKRTHEPILEPEMLAVVRRQVAALVNEQGHLHRKWLSDHNWIVTPVQSEYVETPNLAERAAAVARELSQK